MKTINTINDLTITTCAKCGCRGYLADTEDGEVLIDGRLYDVDRDLAAECGTILVADEHGHPICDDCADYLASGDRYRTPTN